MLEKVQEKTLDEWMGIFLGEAGNVAAEPYLTSEQALDHPQIVHNGNAQDVFVPGVGGTRQLGPMVNMNGTPGSTQGPAPALGQHTAETLARLGGDAGSRSNGAREAMPKHPLEGITLLDLGTVINGPLGCALVAELGARVIRIEAPGGDWGRRGMPMSVHRTMGGSECICLDLKTPEGQEIMSKLAAKADLLLHSMRPGAPERTGIGYEQLAKINPKLVYLYAGGYGSTGPYSHRPSMAPIAGAVSGGGVAQMGRDAFPPPEQAMSIDEIAAVSRKLKRANDGTADHTTGMVNAVGLVLGLYARERTGTAQYVESTMIAANAYANIDDFYWHEGKEPRPLPDGEGHGLHALYRLYRAKTGWVFLACPFEDEWEALCRAIDRPDLRDDPRFASPETRGGARRRAGPRVGPGVRRRRANALGAAAHRRRRGVRQGRGPGDVFLLQRGPPCARERHPHARGGAALRRVLAVRSGDRLLGNAGPGRAGPAEGSAHPPHPQ